MIDKSTDIRKQILNKNLVPFAKKIMHVCTLGNKKQALSLGFIQHKIHNTSLQQKRKML